MENISQPRNNNTRKARPCFLAVLEERMRAEHEGEGEDEVGVED
jgi:hypothetical protein